MDAAPGENAHAAGDLDVHVKPPVARQNLAPVANSETPALLYLSTKCERRHKPGDPSPVRYAGKAVPGSAPGLVRPDVPGGTAVAAGVQPHGMNEALR